jgi:hypothetical protein
LGFESRINIRGFRYYDAAFRVKLYLFLQNWSWVFFGGGELRVSSVFSSFFVRFFARPNFAFGRLRLVQKMASQRETLKSRRSTGTLFSYREMRTRNRVLKPKNPYFVPSTSFANSDKGVWELGLRVYVG